HHSWITASGSRGGDAVVAPGAVAASDPPGGVAAASPSASNPTRSKTARRSATRVSSSFRAAPIRPSACRRSLSASPWRLARAALRDEGLELLPRGVDPLLCVPQFIERLAVAPEPRGEVVDRGAERGGVADLVVAERSEPGGRTGDGLRVPASVVLELGLPL